jgi:hypothetical protein
MHILLSTALIVVLPGGSAMAAPILYYKTAQGFRNGRTRTLER